VGHAYTRVTLLNQNYAFLMTPTTVLFLAGAWLFDNGLLEQLVWLTAKQPKEKIRWLSESPPSWAFYF